MDPMNRKYGAEDLDRTRQSNTEERTRVIERREVHTKRNPAIFREYSFVIH